MRRKGFTMVEVLVVVLALAVLAGLLLVLSRVQRSREGCRRSSCPNNVGNLIKCMHLYADASPNLGSFPIYGSSHNSNGHEAMAKLFDTYVKDYSVFSCPSKATDTRSLKPYQSPNESTLQAGYTNYGYDPGHNPTHSTVGVVGDLGVLHKKNFNSTNHGSDGPGQNVGLGSGSVEWWDTPNRQVKAATGQAIADCIYQDDISADLPEELETYIIK